MTRERPGGSHERLLRPGDDDVESPRVGLERHGPEARHRVDDDERARVVRDLRERLDVGDDAGGGLRVNEEHGARTGLFESGANVLGARRLPPRVPELVDVDVVRPRQRRPPLPELARHDREDALSRREQVDDGRLECGRPGGGEEENVVLVFGKPPAAVPACAA